MQVPARAPAAVRRPAHPTVRSNGSVVEGGARSPHGVDVVLDLAAAADRLSDVQSADTVEPRVVGMRRVEPRRRSNGAPSGGVCPLSSIWCPSGPRSMIPLTVT